MVTLVCDSCSNEFEAKRSNAKFCSTKCRTRRHRQMRTKAVAAERREQAVEAVKVEYPAMSATLTRVTMDELEACGRAETPLGRLALSLALRIDTSTEDESGSAMAALSKELRAALAAAVANAERADDPVDELRARREARRRGA